MADNDAPRAGPVGSRLAGFKKRTPVHCYTQNMKALGLVVSEIFLCFSHDAPGAGPVWTPGARLAGFIIRAVAGQRSSPDLCFATKSIKSMTKDIDLNVTQVGCDGTA